MRSSKTCAADQHTKIGRHQSLSTMWHQSQRVHYLDRHISNQHKANNIFRNETCDHICSIGKKCIVLARRNCHRYHIIHRIWHAVKTMEESCENILPSANLIWSIRNGFSQGIYCKNTKAITLSKIDFRNLACCNRYHSWNHMTCEKNFCEDLESWHNKTVWYRIF